jgi:hypothetical protein
MQTRRRSGNNWHVGAASKSFAKGDDDDGEGGRVGGEVCARCSSSSARREWVQKEQPGWGLRCGTVRSYGPVGKNSGPDGEASASATKAGGGGCSSRVCGAMQCDAV